jgi:hypothetical protein
MRSRSWITGIIALAALSYPGIASSQTFTPFTDVKSVCTSNCQGGPEYDRIVLKDGTELSARIVGENDRFVTLEKFGELRAVGRDQVATMEKNSKAERGHYDDQILLRNGIVLAGTLTSAEADADTFEITSGGVKEAALRKDITAVYHNGIRIYPK